jgi:hypothetical protein
VSEKTKQIPALLTRCDLVALLAQLLAVNGIQAK